MMGGEKEFNLAQAFNGAGNSTAKRDPRHVFDTPFEATDAICVIAKERGLLPNKPRIWEPACGNEAIANRLRNHWSANVVATDIHSGVDYLTCDPLVKTCVITNPPFTLADKFIRRGFEIELRWFALLLKTQFWNTKKSLSLPKPTIWMPLTWRLDFEKKGAPTMDCAWGLWQPPMGDRPTELMQLVKP